MKIISYLPPVLQEIGEFIQMAAAEQDVFDGIDAALTNLKEDLFLSTLTETGVKRWENILGILPKAEDTLETRRFRISALLEGKTPYTFLALKARLTVLCGADGFTAALAPESCTLAVRVALSVRSCYDAVENLLRQMAPANLLVDLSLMYNQHRKFSTVTHAKLAAYTHDQLRNEVFS